MELEGLLGLPLIDSQMAKANGIAVGLARRAQQGRVANLSMQLVSAVHEARGDGTSEARRVALALARLRAAVEEAEKPKN